ncbi:efflux RND transporter permease subunit [Hydrogenimonas sp.]
MEGFFKLLIRYKFLVVALFGAIAAFGWRAYTLVPVDAFPDITPKQVVIYTESPGNSAEDIEKLVTYPVEAAVAGLPGVRMILSNSLFGLSYVAIFFEDDYDIYFLRQLVAERLRSVEIPPGWGRPVMGPNTTGLGQVFWYRLADAKGTRPLAKLRELQEFVVAPMMKAVDGVEEVIGWGGFAKQYEVRIDSRRLQAVGVTYDEVLQALQRANRSAGGQYLELNREQYLIRGDGFYRTLDDIRHTVIKSREGLAVTVGDVASVGVGVAPRFGAVTQDGEETVFGMVLQRSGTDAAKVVERIKAKLPLIDAALPEGVRIETVYDRTDITQKAVGTMKGALLTGAALVTVVLFLFLFELRSAFIVVLALPLSLLVAFLLMRWWGLGANLMSLSGLAIAIGMIVDGTIVVVENAYRLLHERPDADRLALVAEAAAGVAKPVLFALLVIAAFFIPLLSLTGLAGKMYAPMALDIVFAMVGSLLVAMGLVPVLAYGLLRPAKSGESPLMKGLKYLYTPLLGFALRHHRSVVALALAGFLAVAWEVARQGREFMPKLDEEVIMYRVIAIPGTALTASVENAKAIERHILEHYPGAITHAISMIGRSEKGETAQGNYMELLVTLKPGTRKIAELGRRMTADLQKSFPYLQFVPTQPIAMRIEELLEGIKAELAVKIYGEDQKVMARIAEGVRRVLGSVEGLSHAEIESQLGQAQIVIRPDYLALSRYGVEVDEIMRLIRHGVGEEPVGWKLEGVRRFGIVAKIEGAKKSVESLEETLVRSRDGKMVPLRTLCDIRVVQGSSFIKRENLSRYLVLSLEVEGRDIASFVEEARARIANEVTVPKGYYLRWAGDFKNMQEAAARLALIVPATLLLVLLLLYTAFGGMKKALLVLLGVPLGLIGAGAALVLAGEYLSVSAIVGFIAVAAIAILNGIVLISFVDELRAKFPDLPAATLIKEAALLRLRPVLMTAFTTLFGILPLLWATGVGSEVQYPLALVVTGGIVSSTLLTLLVLPALYLLFFAKK